MQKDSNQPERKAASGMPAFFRSREASVFIVLMLLYVIMLALPTRDRFFSERNMQNILTQTALLAVFAIGETLVILTGGIDLSLGSLIGFAGMVLALLVTTLDPTPLSTSAAMGAGVVLTLIMALGIGMIHALLIHRLRLPAFVVTLVSLLVLRSQALVLNHQRQIPIPGEQYPLFDWLANGRVGPVPVPLLILVLVAVAAHLLLTQTRMGRYLYSVGSNEQATMLSGVNVQQVKLFAYGASAFLGGLAAILWAGYGGQGDPSAGNAYELDAVAATVVGGASLTGGQGSVAGTVIGALLLHSIFSAINLTFSEPSLWRGTVVGGVLLFAVLVTAFQQRPAR